MDRDKFISVNSVLVGLKTFRECYKEQENDITLPFIKFSYNTLDMVEEFIKRTPPVDVAPVVRCKDCVHYKQVQGAIGGWCDCELTPFDMDPNDFCSLGERKTNDENV